MVAEKRATPGGQWAQPQRDRREEGKDGGLEATEDRDQQEDTQRTEREDRSAGETSGNFLSTYQEHDDGPGREEPEL